jgi:hypothetical protein
MANNENKEMNTSIFSYLGNIMQMQSDSNDNDENNQIEQLFDGESVLFVSTIDNSNNNKPIYRNSRSCDDIIALEKTGYRHIGIQTLNIYTNNIDNLEQSVMIDSDETEPIIELNAESTIEHNTESTTELKAEINDNPMAELKAEINDNPMAEHKAEHKAEPKTEPKTEPIIKPIIGFNILQSKLGKFNAIKLNKKRKKKTIKPVDNMISTTSILISVLSAMSVVAGFILIRRKFYY